jgi:hypothetical protein
VGGRKGDCMKKYILSFGALTLAVTFLLSSISGKAFADVSTWQKSVMIQPQSPTDYASSTFDQSVSNAIADGANYITLVIPVVQSNIYSTDVQTGPQTPTDQSLESAVSYIHSHGASVAFSLHDDPEDGNWRALINPTDRTTWFANYGAQLNHYAVLGQNLGVQELVIGTEMSDMTIPSVNSTNTANWIALIKTVRSEYSGKLTYSAQHDGYMADDQSLGFWPELDYIGLSAYYGLGSGDESVATIESNWNQWENDVQSLSQEYGKQVLFTEVGYVSQTNALNDPGSAYADGGSVDDSLQANAYQALFQYWNNYSFMSGVAFWGWSSDPNAGGTSDTNYTPQNKPAEQIMKDYFSDTSTTPTAPNTPTTPAVPTAPATYTASSATSGTDNTNSPLTINVAASASQATANAIVDVEVYNAQNQQVYQQYYPSQTISSGGNSFSTNYTPSVAGTYTIRLGIFTANWASNLYWNNSAATVNVTAPAATPPPITINPVLPTASSSSTIDIWWPASTATVSGVQPFKALIDGVDQNSYDMYWQVDNGALNLMTTNDSPTAHKEAEVDLSSWNWNSNDQYTITFVAKNSSGNVISTKSVVISI